MIPISTVRFGPEHEKQVLEVLRSGHLAQGKKVAEFEALCAEMAGTRAAVAVNSGTAALVLALRVLGVGPGDEVITSPFTFAATLNAILEVGATARFGDIDDTFNLDPSSVEPLINSSTKVLMPVHLYGRVAQMDAFSDIAASHELQIVEDAAQAHFAATETGQAVGSFGLGCFSFYATKNLTSGEGGVITVDDPEIEESMRTLRNQGMRQRYQYEVPGYNLRLTDLAASIALPQFGQAKKMLNHRYQNALQLSEGLSEIQGLTTPNIPDPQTHVWHQYTVVLDSSAKINREEFAETLTEAEIGYGFYYPRTVYDYDCYRSHPRVIIDGSPSAEKAASSVISLPVHPHLSTADIEYIVDTTTAVLKV